MATRYRQDTTGDDPLSGSFGSGSSSGQIVPEDSPDAGASVSGPSLAGFDTQILPAGYSAEGRGIVGENPDREFEGFAPYETPDGTRYLRPSGANGYMYGDADANMIT